MKYILKEMKRILEKAVFRFFYIFPIKKHQILFESEPDLTDNSFAFYEFLSEKEQYKSYRLIWLVESSYEGDSEHIYKWHHGISIKRLYYLATSKYFIFDHNNILSEYPIRKDQKIINLFHGCSFKKTKGGPVNTDTEDMLLVTGDFWKPIMAEFVSCNKKKVKSLGFPRNDYLFMEKNDKQEKWRIIHSWSNYNKILLWMPTFRRSNSDTISENYYSGVTGLPILEQKTDLEELNERLRGKNTLLVFKVHHLQLEYSAFKDNYSNIQILKDDDINSFGLQLYQIVPLTDALITDYSSISNDYLLLDKPMIFTLDDYEEYRRSRGFSIDDPAQYFPGYHVFNKPQLIEAISKTIDGEDPYIEKRHALLSIMHKYQDGNSCKRIAEYIGL